MVTPLEFELDVMGTKKGCRQACCTALFENNDVKFDQYVNARREKAVAATLMCSLDLLALTR